MTTAELFADRWECPDCGLLISRNPHPDSPRLGPCRGQVYLTYDCFLGARDPFDALVAIHVEKRTLNPIEKPRRAMFLALLRAHQDVMLAFHRASDGLVPGASCLLDAAEAIEQEWNRLTAAEMPKLTDEKSFVMPPLRSDAELLYSSAERGGFAGRRPT